MIKKTLLLLAVSALAMLPGSDLYAAQKKVLSPADTIKAFHTAMANCDFASAKKYVEADEMKKMIAALETLIKEVPSLKEDTKKDFTPLVNAKIVSEKITGNKATVVFTYAKGKKTTKETLNLKKRNNIWVIE